MLRLRAHFLCPRTGLVVTGQHRLARGSQGYVVWILGQFGVHGTLMPGQPPAASCTLFTGPQQES